MEFTSEWFKSNLKWMAAKLISFAFGCPSLGKIIPHALQERQLELTVWMGFLFSFLMLWLKSFLEQQVLFTVKLTAGASSVKQLIRVEARVWITVHIFSGNENCSAGSPLVTGFSVLLGRAHHTMVLPNGKQGSKKSVCHIACLHLRGP